MIGCPLFGMSASRRRRRIVAVCSARFAADVRVGGVWMIPANGRVGQGRRRSCRSWSRSVLAAKIVEAVDGTHAGSDNKAGQPSQEATISAARATAVSVGSAAWVSPP
jgi:hypothetical protein